MNRFITIRVSGGLGTLESVADQAHKLQIVSSLDKGFEISVNTRSRLILSWFEKVITERQFESGHFGGITYQEVKIINFDLMLYADSDEIILVDPPLGKHRAITVLRKLFPSNNFVFLPIDVKRSVELFRQSEQLFVTAVETALVSINQNIAISMTAVGRRDVSKHLADAYPRFNQTFKSAQITSQIQSGGECNIVISSSGLVKFSQDVTHEDIEIFAHELVLKEDV